MLRTELHLHEELGVNTDAYTRKLSDALCPFSFSMCLSAAFNLIYICNILSVELQKKYI